MSLNEDSAYQAYLLRQDKKRELDSRICISRRIREIRFYSSLGAIIFGACSLLNSGANERNSDDFYRDYTRAVQYGAGILSGFTLMASMIGGIRAHRKYGKTRTAISDANILLEREVQDLFGRLSFEPLSPSELKRINEYVKRGIDCGYIDLEHATVAWSKQGFLRRAQRAKDDELRRTEGDEELRKRGSYDFMPPEDQPNWKGTD